MLDIGLATLFCEKEHFWKDANKKNDLDHLKSIQGVEGSLYRRVVIPHGELRFFGSYESEALPDDQSNE